MNQVSQRNASGQRNPSTPAKGWQFWLASSLMLIGLMLLVIQFGIHSTQPKNPMATWTPTEQEEFTTLKRLVHAAPKRGKRDPSDAEREMSIVYERMNQLETVKTERERKSARREWLVRIAGLSLLSIGIFTYLLHSASTK